MSFLDLDVSELTGTDYMLVTVTGNCPAMHKSLITLCIVTVSAALPCSLNVQASRTMPCFSTDTILALSDNFSTSIFSAVQ